MNPWTGREEKFIGGRIEHWRIVESHGNPIAIGLIYDDPRGDLGPYSGDFRDGNHIITSIVINQTDSTLETLNTIYTLGVPYDKSNS